MVTGLPECADSDEGFSDHLQDAGPPLTTGKHPAVNLHTVAVDAVGAMEDELMSGRLRTVVIFHDDAAADLRRIRAIVGRRLLQLLAQLDVAPPRHFLVKFLAAMPACPVHT